MHVWSFLLVNSYFWCIVGHFCWLTHIFDACLMHFCWLTHIFGAFLMHFCWLTHIFDALFDAFLLVNSYFWCFNSKPQISKKLTTNRHIFGEEFAARPSSPSSRSFGRPWWCASTLAADWKNGATVTWLIPMLNVGNGWEWSIVTILLTIMFFRKDQALGGFHSHGATPIAGWFSSWKIHL